MTDCALKITHIGERLFAEALNEDPELRYAITGNYKKWTAIPEAPFLDNTKAACFDGEHKIDVLLIPEDIPEDTEVEAIPVELKLGNTRMDACKSEFGRFLTGYKKGKNKFTGSMISILNQKKAEVAGEEIDYPLCYLYQDKPMKISAEWILIVLTETIANDLENNEELWENGKSKPTILSFQKLFKGKGARLNRIVERLTKSEDYYKTWINE